MLNSPLYLASLALEISSLMRNKGPLSVYESYPEIESSLDLFHIGIQLIADGTGREAIEFYLQARSSNSYIDQFKINLINFIYEEVLSPSMKINSTVIPTIFYSSPRISDEEAKKVVKPEVFNKLRSYSNHEWRRSDEDNSIVFSANTSTNARFSIHFDKDQNLTKYFHINFVGYAGKSIVKTTRSPLNLSSVIDILDSGSLLELSFKADSVVET
jgi:hypothetical protein